MNAQLTIQPSSFVDTGIQIKPVRGGLLFKCSEDLQERMETLNEKKENQNYHPMKALSLQGFY